MSTLTIEALCFEAAQFSAVESRHPEPLELAKIALTVVRLSKNL
jgi:hypothetical protein